MTLDSEVASLQVDLETVPRAPECLRQQVTQLGADPEPQLQMVWKPQTWIKWLDDLPQTRQYLEDLEKRMTENYGKPAVNRADVMSEVQTELAADRVHLAFIAVMIWGYGLGGLGPYRTSKILRQTKTGKNAPLSEAALRSLAAAAAATANDTTGMRGFYILNNSPTKLKHLGPAFFTKWLSFASMQDNPDEDGALPILDAVVAKWIKNHTKRSDAPNGIDLNPQKSRATRRYHQYLQLLDAWRNELHHNYTRAQLERTIFTGRVWDKSCSNFSTLSS